MLRRFKTFKMVRATVQNCERESHFQVVLGTANVGKDCQILQGHGNTR